MADPIIAQRAPYVKEWNPELTGGAGAAVQGPAVLRRLPQGNRIHPHRGEDRGEEDGRLVRLQTLRHQAVLQRDPFQTALRPGRGFRDAGPDTPDVQARIDKR